MLLSLPSVVEVLALGVVCSRMVRGRLRFEQKRVGLIRSRVDQESGEGWSREMHLRGIRVGRGIHIKLSHRVRVPVRDLANSPLTSI